jgi:hypothetical protein
MTGSATSPIAPPRPMISTSPSIGMSFQKPTSLSVRFLGVLTSSPP